MLKLHHTVRWFSQPWRKITAIAEDHGTRQKSRGKPRWSWIRDYLTALRNATTPTSTNFVPVAPCWGQPEARAEVLSYSAVKLFGCIMWKITNFSGSTPVPYVALSAVNTPPKIRTNLTGSYTTVHSTSLATFLSLTVEAHVHSVTYSQLRKPQRTYVRTSSVQSEKRTLSWIGHSRSSLLMSAEIQIPERSVVVRYNNVDLICETYEDRAMGKLQFRRFQPPHSSFMTVVREMPSDIYKSQAAR